jgi:hypothetical protein
MPGLSELSSDWEQPEVPKRKGIVIKVHTTDKNVRFSIAIHLAIYQSFQESVRYELFNLVV